MNSWFLSLLKKDKKKERIKVIREDSFPLFSRRFQGEIWNDVAFHFRIPGCYEVDFMPISGTDFQWAFYCVIVGVTHSNYTISKDELNLIINKLNFRGRNIFLRLEERMIYNLISVV